LYCDGSAVSRTQYADLFKAISTTYGVGDGSTTFNLPNLKGVFARGAGSQTISGVTYTGTLGSSQVDQMQGHYHNKAAIDDTNYRLLNVSTSGGVDANDGAPNFTTVAASSALNITSPSTDGTNGTPRTGSETRPANVAVAYHIRYLATYQMSNDTDTRVVAARAVLTTAGTTLNGNAYNRLNYNSVQYDTHSAITTGAGVWKYTIPIGGYYKIGASINTGAVVPATYCQILMTPVINGVVNSDVVLSHIRQSTISFNKPSGSTQYKFNAGDYFYIQSICDNPVNSATLNEPETGWVTVERLSGPATIAASETVAASYNSSTTVFPVGPSETTIVNPNKVYDSHNAYNSSTGIYTVPISGKYRLTSYVYSGSSATNTIASQILIRLFRGLTSDVVIASNFYQTTNSIFAWVGGSVSIAANAGEQLSLKVGLTTGAAGFTANGNLNTFFMIERIGN
jgi:microcystin-dependent protein